MKKVLLGMIAILLVSAPFLAAQLIVIDGEKDAFYETLTGPDDGHLQLRAFHGNDNGYPLGDADLSAKVWTAWDEEYFYIYEEVTDDIISMTSSNTYQNDCIEIKVDPMATDSVKNSVISFDMTALDTTGGITGVATIDSSFRKLTDTGYVLEAAIPWTDMVSGTETVPVGVDNVFGLCIQNHDNDNPKGNRDASVQWAAVLTDAAWNQPKYLATAKFLADNKLQLIPSNNMTGVTNPLPYDGTVSNQIVVDGKLDPFYNLLTGPDDGVIQLKPYAFSPTIGIPFDEDDLSATIYGAWDETNLYLYAEITDDTVSCPNTSNFWRNDCLELKIDGLIDGSTVGGPPTGGGLSSTNTITALDTPAATGQVSHLENLEDEDKMFVRTLTDDGYAIEMALKLDTLGGPEMINAIIDSTFGLGINIVDNDGLEATSNRQAAIVWGAVCSDNIWNTPDYLGQIQFKADNKIAFLATNGNTGETNKVPYDGSFFINVDGIKDPWYNQLKRPRDGYVQIQSCHFSDLGAPASHEDLSAKVWSSWDDTWLYMYAEITDDTVACPNTAAFYRNDCLELKVDGVADDSTQTSISMTATLTALDSSETDGVANQLDEVAVEDKMYARGDLDEGYTLELAIKLDALGGTEDINAAVGEVFGLGINVVDNDGTEPTSNRHAAIVWAAVCDDHIWNTPKYHGTVEFLADHKLNFIPVNNMTDRGHGIPYDGTACPSAVDDEFAVSPLNFKLLQNYPNPFNPTTTISFEIPKVTKVRLVVYDVLGRQVATLVDEVMKPGTHATTFDGQRYASGIYFFRLETDSHIQVKKMMMLK